MPAAAIPQAPAQERPAAEAGLVKAEGRATPGTQEILAPAVQGPRVQEELPLRAPATARTATALSAPVAPGAVGRAAHRATAVPEATPAPARQRPQAPQERSPSPAARRRARPAADPWDRSRLATDSARPAAARAREGPGAGRGGAGAPPTAARRPCVGT